MQRIWRAAAMVVGLAAARSAAAQVVYDGGAPSDVQATGLSDEYLLLQGFALGGPVTIDAARFWGATDNPADAPHAWPIRYAVYTRTGTAVGALVFSGTTTAVGTLRRANWLDTYDSYQYDITLAPRALTAGDYWFGLGTTTGAVFWELTAPRVEPTAGLYPDGTTLAASDDLAFQLRGTATTVPEPGSMALVATGALLVGGWARRRRGAAG